MLLLNYALMVGSLGLVFCVGILTATICREIVKVVSALTRFFDTATDELKADSNEVTD